jgi:hypothetical protein
MDVTFCSSAGGPFAVDSTRLNAMAHRIVGRGFWHGDQPPSNWPQESGSREGGPAVTGPFFCLVRCGPALGSNGPRMAEVRSMIFYHRDLKIQLDDSWWAEAQMGGFVPSSNAYRVDVAAAKGQRVFEARIDEIGPVQRKPGVGIFNSNEEMTARQRVLRILYGFRTSAAIPPIELVDAPAGSPFRYKLTAGTHRLYCSLAAGFSHVPAVEGFDITAQYI